MKLIVFILIFISVSYAFEDKCQGAFVRTVHKKCMLANGGDKAVIEEIIQFKETDNENSKCFRDCIMRECNYFGSDGKLNHDSPKRLSRLLHGGNKSNMKPIEEAAAECLASQTYFHSKCENAEIFARCLIRNSPVKLRFYNVYD